MPSDSSFTSAPVVPLGFEGFAGLSRHERRAAWHLCLAASAGQEVALDQLGWDSVALVRLLEAIVLTDPAGAPPDSAAARIASYLVDVHAHGGVHDAYSGEKRQPSFTRAELESAMRTAAAAGAPLPADEAGDVEPVFRRICRTLFDPQWEPRRSGAESESEADPLATAAVTFYERGLTLADVEGLDERYPLTSRVARGADGRPVEAVYRAGTDEVAPGLYAAALRRVCAHLEEAARCLDGPAATSLQLLVRALRTGETADLEAHRVAWLKADAGIDSIIGFCDTYADPRARKGLWDSLVYCRAPADALAAHVGAHAQYFEERMPWPDRYKRTHAVPAVVGAHDLLWTTALPPVGINLPDEQHLREQHGTRSLILMNAFLANQAHGELPILEELSLPEDREAARQYGNDAWRMLIVLHEVIGHASGLADADLDGDPATALGEHANTIEEARADLVALWHAFDPCLAEVVPSHGDVARQLYRSYLVDNLANLRWQTRGTTLTQDHFRAQNLVVETLIAEGVAARVGAPGQRSLRVVDFDAMRRSVGALLSMLMTIRATGDRAAADRLVRERAIEFDPSLRDEVVARIARVGVPTLYKASPGLRPILDRHGELVDVEVNRAASDRADLLAQTLERSLLGRLPPAQATRAAAELEGDGLVAAMRAAASSLPMTPSSSGRDP